MVITAIIHPWYIPDTLADTYSIHHVRDFSAAMSQDQALNPGLNLRHDINTSLILNNYITFFCQFTTNTFKIHCQYIWIAYEIHSKNSIYVLRWYYSLSFGPCLSPHSSPVCQCVRPGAWSVEAPCGCLTSSGFCWTAPNRACWNIHALEAKKHVWCCHAMAVSTLQEPDPWAADAQNWMPS